MSGHPNGWSRVFCRALIGVPTTLFQSFLLYIRIYLILRSYPLLPRIALITCLAACNALVLYWLNVLALHLLNLRCLASKGMVFLELTSLTLSDKHRTLQEEVRCQLECPFAGAASLMRQIYSHTSK